MGYSFNVNIFSLSTIRNATWFAIFLSSLCSITLLFKTDNQSGAYMVYNEINETVVTEKPPSLLFQKHQDANSSDTLDAYACSLNDSIFRQQLFKAINSTKSVHLDTQKHRYSSYPDINLEELLRNILTVDNSSHRLQCTPNLDLAVFVHIAPKEAADIQRMVNIR